MNDDHRVIPVWLLIIALILIAFLCSCSLLKSNDYGAGIVVEPLKVVPLQPIALTPVTNNFSTAVKPSTTKPEKPVTPIPVTNTVIIEPIEIPSNSLIAGDGGCAKTNRTCSAVTNKPPVIAGPCLPESIESVPLEPIPLKPIPVDVIQPIIVEEIQLTEVELPETGVVAWGLALYYILTLLIIGGGYVAWKKYQKRKLAAKPATKRKPRKRVGRKKR